MLRQIAPIGFVFLWSTGWIVARYAADFSDLMFFLLLRFLFAGCVLATLALAVGAAWPKRGAARTHAILSGMLLHTGYLGGVWWAIEHGLSASLSALIAALQPILTAIFAPLLLGESFGIARALGVALGFGGLVLVLVPRLLALAGSGDVPAGTLILVNCLAMISVTAGTFYQKRFVRTGDLPAVAALQYGGAVISIVPLLLLFGEIRFQSTPFAWGVMAWAVLAISVGAIVLLLLLIRQGEVTQASQLLFLVPPVGALQAMVLFGDTLSPIQWIGMAVTTLGVAVARQRQ